MTKVSCTPSTNPDPNQQRAEECRDRSTTDQMSAKPRYRNVCIASVDSSMW